MKPFLRKVETFFFQPASPAPLAALRIGVTLILIVQALCLAPYASDFLSGNGIVPEALKTELAIPGAPRLGPVVSALSFIGIGESDVIHGACFLYFIALCFLLAGLFTRLAAIIALSLHWTLFTTAAAIFYGADCYARIFLFYFVFLPVGSAYSLDCLLSRKASDPSWEARLGLRVVQLHLCFSYFMSALAKMKGPQWWDGELLWRMFSLPMFHVFNMDWLAFYPWLSKLGGWATLVIETFYPIFIWPSSTRRIWVVATVAFHIGIAVFIGLGIFGSLMAVLTLATFGVSAEPLLREEPARPEMALRAELA